MTYLYWICLALGGTLLAVSLLAGHDADGSGADGPADVHADADHAGSGEALRWLNFRALVFGVAFFGLGGVVARPLGLFGSAQFLFAAAAGSSVGLLAGWLFSFARRSELDTRVGALAGRTGTVLVPPAPGQLGKVRLLVAGQSEDVLAASPDELRPGEAVIVIAEGGGQVDVRRWDGL